ncbi:MAG: RES family NAD+ phosphorylase, partial [Mycobacteriales bacterium]
ALPRRFSPINDAAGSQVPVLYAGDSLACALGETVFHDIPDDAAVPAEIFRADLLTLRAGFFTLARDITVADLTDAALAALHRRRADVIDTTPADYPVTVTWAQAAWDTTATSGLAWNSRRGHDRLSYLLFVDPVTAPDRSRAVRRKRDFAVTRPPLPLYDDDGLGAVVTAATARNVSVIF